MPATVIDFLEFRETRRQQALPLSERPAPAKMAWPGDRPLDPKAVEHRRTMLEHLTART